MLEKILEFDTSLFNLINHCRCTAMDWIMSFLSWYVFIYAAGFALALLIMWKNNFKYWYLYAIFFILSVSLADRLSVVCFKDVFCRLRPSHTLPDSITVKLQSFALDYSYRGGLYGFVSSHASNLFSIITFASLSLPKDKYFKPILTGLLLFGLFGIYSRVYCGYHYPSDVICGSLLGAFLGFVSYKLCSLLILKIKSKKEKSLQ
ncbi:MAG: phosphatase PAP2 family protein [Bacteroidales bacterium]|nr:phosphatase PAP2 family protein [Bacteroidales bacterium]